MKAKKVEKVIPKKNSKNVVVGKGKNSKVVEVENKKQREVKPEVKQEVKPTKWEDLSPPEQVIRVVKKLVDTIAGSGDLEKLAKDTLENAGLVAIKSAVVNQIPGNMEIPIMQRSQSSVEVKSDGKGKLSFTVKSYSDNITEATKLALAEVEKLLEFEVAEE